MSRWFPESATLWLRPQKSEPSLSTFERELDQRALRRGARLTCIVAGEGVRYRIVPWHSELTRLPQRQILATQCFHEAYGEVARGWTVRQHTLRHGAATLACALDTALLDRLAALAQARQLKLVSVQPALMHAYNRARRQLDAGLFWFVWIDGPFVTLLLQAAGEPLQVKAMASPTDLSALLDREWFTLGMEAPRCPVYVARSSLGGPPTHRTVQGGWRFIELPAVPEAAWAGLSALQAA